jgi:hypothetical protein
MCRHSRCAGADATRGGFTIREGARSSPASCISSTPRPTCAELLFISCRSSHVARLQTNSPVSSMLASVSLTPPSAWLPFAPKTTIGGASAIALKNENGARLTTPDRLCVEIQPIGRGTTSDLKGLCLRPCGPLAS